MTKAELIEKIEKINTEEEAQNFKESCKNDDSLKVRITEDAERCLNARKNGSVEAVKKLNNGKTVIVFRY